MKNEVTLTQKELVEQVTALTCAVEWLSELVSLPFDEAMEFVIHKSKLIVDTMNEEVMNHITSDFNKSREVENG